MTWKSVLMQFRTIDCERSQIIQNRTTKPSSVPFSNNVTAGLERDIRLKYIQAGNVQFPNLATKLLLRLCIHTILRLPRRQA